MCGVCTVEGMSGVAECVSVVRAAVIADGAAAVEIASGVAGVVIVADAKIAGAIVVEAVMTLWCGTVGTAAVNVCEIGAELMIVDWTICVLSGMGWRIGVWLICLRSEIQWIGGEIGGASQRVGVWK